MRKEMMKGTAIGLWIGKAFTTALAVMAAFMAPLWGFLIGVLVLVMVDTITGIKASVKKKVKITSSGLWRTGSKLINYSLLIIAAHLMSELFFKQVGVPFAPLAASFVALVEFKSLCENLEVLTGIDLWSKIAAIIPNVKLKSRKTKDGTDSDGAKGSIS